VRLIALTLVLLTLMACELGNEPRFGPRPGEATSTETPEQVWLTPIASPTSPVDLGALAEGLSTIEQGMSKAFSVIDSVASDETSKALKGSLAPLREASETLKEADQKLGDSSSADNESQDTSTNPRDRKAGRRVQESGQSASQTQMLTPDTIQKVTVFCWINEELVEGDACERAPAFEAWYELEISNGVTGGSYKVLEAATDFELFVLDVRYQQNRPRVGDTWIENEWPEDLQSPSLFKVVNFVPKCMSKYGGMCWAYPVDQVATELMLKDKQGNITTTESPAATFVDSGSAISLLDVNELPVRGVFWLIAE
tara:strand:+ start:834 stop:1772 length:939 start_codon:yes stop_codon:yes gene_type:complete